MSTPFTLRDKKILVIGASSGIGKHTAILSSNLGAEVIILSRNESKLQDTFCKLDGNGHNIAALDITDYELVDSFLMNLDKLDGVVYSAGTLKTLPAKFINDRDINEVFSLNFNALVNFTTKLLANKKLNKNSSLVFVSSIANGLVTEVGNSIYSASKGAISAYARVLALELVSRKIRVNTVVPGMVRTNFMKKASIASDQFSEDEKRYPLGYGEPEDVANAIVFLLADASKWITGTNLLLDGGLTLR